MAPIVVNVSTLDYLLIYYTDIALLCNLLYKKSVTIRMRAVVLGACVAALVSATGCSGSQPTEEASELPDITETQPAGYDRWEEMDGGRIDVPEVDVLAEQYGLEEIRMPSDKYFADYYGVSRLDEYCVVGFMGTMEDASQGLTGVVIMSRYNSATYILLGMLAPDDVRAQMDKYRPYCAGEQTLEETLGDSPAEMATIQPPSTNV